MEPATAIIEIQRLLDAKAVLENSKKELARKKKELLEAERQHNLTHPFKRPTLSWDSLCNNKRSEETLAIFRRMKGKSVHLLTDEEYYTIYAAVQ